jgi:hypothetical protein
VRTGPTIATDIYTVGRTLAKLTVDLADDRYAETLPGRDQVPLFERYESFYRLLVRATNPLPAQRFSSADEMANQCKGVLHEILAEKTGLPSPRKSVLFGVPRSTFGADLALRLAAFAALVPGTYVAVWAARRSFGGQSRLEAHALGAAGLAATVLTAWWGTWIIRMDVGMTYAYYPEVVWLGLYSLAVGLVGRRLRAPAVRWLARILQLPTLLLLVGSAGWQVPWTWLVPAAVVAVAGIYLADWLFAAENQSRREAGFSRAAKLVACLGNLAWGGLLINTSLPVLYQQPFPLRLATLSTRNHLIVSFIGLYGLATLLLGLKIKLPDARRLGLGLQAAALLGLVGVAVQNSAAPLWLRGASYIVCIGSLYALRKLTVSAAPPVSDGERLTATTLPLIGTGLTVVWLAFQVSEYFRPFYIDATASERLLTASTQSFSISAAWGLYGLLVLVIGFSRRHRWTRLIGLGTLALTLVKIGAYDMWKLAVQSRIWITIGLCIIFVAASLLYTRYRRLILTDTPKEEIGA